MCQYLTGNAWCLCVKLTRLLKPYSNGAIKATFKVMQVWLGLEME